MRIRSVEELVRLYRERADLPYGLEGVTQLQHALQGAHLSRREGHRRELVVATLFHDVGHLLGRLDDNPAERGIDDRHEVSGGRILAALFGEAIAQPTRLHVAAKRYLCAVEPDYFAGLSGDSVRSLALQGGPMSAAECAAFETEPGWEDALRVRRWDDRAKDPAAVVPGLDAYLDDVAACAKAA
ncbi:MAG: HD domain-containing protein [Alphaproteobacteria bacterium]